MFSGTSGFPSDEERLLARAINLEPALHVGGVLAQGLVVTHPILRHEFRRTCEDGEAGCVQCGRRDEQGVRMAPRSYIELSRRPLRLSPSRNS